MIKIKHKNGSLYAVDENVFCDLVSKGLINEIVKSDLLLSKACDRIKRIFKTENSVTRGLLRNMLRMEIGLFDDAIKSLANDGFIKIEKLNNKYMKNGYENIVCIK